ncbi:hypothetical protein [Neptunomonas phycophila]|uniref:hypothetical protein n=1 Tax=Neptunomonas phycophila TaxID=1572645 RepID=UPI003BAC2D28
MYKIHHSHDDWIRDVRKTYEHAIVDDLRDTEHHPPFMSIARDRHGHLVGSFYHHTKDKRGFTKHLV